MLIYLDHANKSTPSLNELRSKAVRPEN